jgi:CheY-like chemotaxis protein
MTRILVVDDDPLICSSMRIWLEAKDFEVVLANGARPGLKALERATFDVMVIDIFMPDMDGLESIKTFHQRAPRVPIIAISGVMFRDHLGPAPDFLGMSTHLGAAYCLRKPFKPKDLLQAIAHVLLSHAVRDYKAASRDVHAP